MISFKRWLAEDAGETVGTKYNDVIMQSRVKSNHVATENKPEMSDDKAKCKFLGLCGTKKQISSNLKRLPQEL